MSAEKLIHTMERLCKLHRSLLELSKQKTDIVVKGDMDALNQILKDEQAHIAAINKFENDRQAIAKIMIPTSAQPTITDCLEVIEGPEKDKLILLRTELLELIKQINEKNSLNQQLIYQSLQFVNLSLNLFMPQDEDINYGPMTHKVNVAKGLFNSKA
ncbi:MAG: flagellar protein FlgN [Bacillota bacterium]|nr:flagellar protein FlgN [Bacillota bacterium]